MTEKNPTVGRDIIWGFGNNVDLWLLLIVIYTIVEIGARQSHIAETDSVFIIMFSGAFVVVGLIYRAHEYKNE